MTATETRSKSNTGAKDVAVEREIKPGMTVRVHQELTEKNAKGEEKKRIQVFEGVVLAHRHGREIGSTITVRKIASGVGVEKIFPLNSPLITKNRDRKTGESTTGKTPLSQGSHEETSRKKTRLKILARWWNW